MDGWLYKIDRDSHPSVFELERNDDGLWLNTNWVNPINRWDPGLRLVFSVSKFLLFRLVLLGGFSFQLTVKLFFQPPNILPISSSFSEIISYCLLEISFASHVIDIRNLTISRWNIHCEIFADFSPFPLK